MTDKLKEISRWFLKQGINSTREALEEKIQEAYNQGKNESLKKQVDKTIDDIYYNVIKKIQQDKKVLYENNFYNQPSEKDVIQMRALEYLEEYIEEIIKQYK